MWPKHIKKADKAEIYRKKNRQEYTEADVRKNNNLKEWLPYIVY